MARTVKDAAYVLQAIAGKDPDDNYTSAIPSIPDYVAACKLSGLQGARIGIPRNIITPRPGDAAVLAAFESAISLMREAGATIVDDANITPAALEEYTKGKAYNIVFLADFVADLPNRYLSKLTSNPQRIFSVADLNSFTKSHPLEEYPDRDTAIFDQALALGFNNTDPRFWPAYQTILQTGGVAGILGVLANNSLDALITPSDFSNGLPAFVGTPVITVPLGFYPADTKVVKNGRGDLVSVGPNIPFGLSFMGKAWSEERLISLAYAFEQRTLVRGRVRPYLVPKTEMSDVVGA